MRLENGVPMPEFGRFAQMLERCTEAMIAAHREGNTLYVFQVQTGEWVYSLYPSADDPHIEVTPTGDCRMICDWCDGEKKARHRVKQGAEV
jgi:hypothetical protein